MTINPSDIKKIIEAEDDFGHEMRVGHILAEGRCATAPGQQSTGFIHMAQHGGTYIDSVTEKPRQFDYRCQIHYSSGYSGRDDRRVFLAVECKNLHDSAPLVVCGRPRSDEEAFHYLVLSTLPSPPGVEVAKMEQFNSFYEPKRFVGKSLVRPKVDQSSKSKSESQSDVYDRWSQAVASSRELVKSACSSEKIHPNANGIRSFVIPVVVIPDQLLWQAEYASDGTITGLPENVDECEFFVGSPIDIFPTGRLRPKFAPQYVLSHIHFVTLIGLSKLLSRFLDRPGDGWSRIFGRL